MKAKVGYGVEQCITSKTGSEIVDVYGFYDDLNEAIKVYQKELAKLLKDEEFQKSFNFKSEIDAGKFTEIEIISPNDNKLPLFQVKNKKGQLIELYVYEIEKGK